MPELPEVEVVKRSLERKIINLIIKKVKINDGNLRYKINKFHLTKLYGKKVIKIRQHTRLNLQIGPAQIGVIRNINTAIIFNLLSVILNQLLLPSTYCPIGNLVIIFI